MKRIPFTVCLLTMLLLLSGCSSTNVTIFGYAYPQKEQDATIDIYITKTPTQEYTEFAKLVCKLSNEEKCFKRLMAKARELGADGLIVIGKAGSTSVGVPLGSYAAYIDTKEYGITAIAIKYKEE